MNSKADGPDKLTTVSRSPKRKNHFPFVDAARGLAILLAMLGHANNQYALTGIFSPFTRTATPTFLVIFGIMIEVVYVRKLREGQNSGRAAAALDRNRRRFIERMITCYLVFGLICLAAYVSDKLSGERFLAAVTYTGNGRFGNILRLYSLMFLLLLVTLPFLGRYGWRAVMTAGLGAWILSLSLEAAGIMPNYTVHMILGHGFGHGPAAALSLVFVAFGMMIGASICGREGWRAVAIFWALSGVALIIGAIQQGPFDLLRNIVTGYRGENHPLYYAYGIFASGMWLIFFHSITGRLRAIDILVICGTQSLFLYGLGNVTLNLLPIDQVSNVALRAIYLTLFMVGLMLLAKDRQRESPWMHRLTFNIFARASQAYTNVLRRLLGIDQKVAVKEE